MQMHRVWGCTVRCVKNWLFRPVFPDDQGDCGNFCSPVHRTAQIVTQSQKSENEFNQPMFHTENARLLSESAVFALWTYASLVVGGFQGGHGKRRSRAVRAICPCCAEAPPF